MLDTPRIILDLIGGSEDGIRYDGGAADGYYWQSNHGRVGARFRLIPEARLFDQLLVRDKTDFERSHFEVYEIEYRCEEWDHIYLRARYLGREDIVAIDAAE